MNNGDLTENRLRGGFYVNPDGDPYFNMGFDNWLFEQVQTDIGFPPVVLRLYTWNIPAITIGYHQDADRIIDKTKLDSSIPVIRRITGGRAIYHDCSEITFTLISTLNLFPESSRSLSQTNRKISETIVGVLDQVGVISDWKRKSDLSFSGNDRAGAKSCFNSYSKYEIFSEAGKVVAGAQRRRGQYFIHQGSIKINGICSCEAIGQIGAPEIIDSAEGRSYKYTINDFIGPFRAVFAQKMGVNFENRTVDEGRLPEILRFSEVTGKK